MKGNLSPFTKSCHSFPLLEEPPALVLGEALNEVLAGD